MKSSLDLSTLTLEDMSYEAVEALFKLIGALNQSSSETISLQNPEVMKDVRRSMLSNNSKQVMDMYLELLYQVRDSMGIGMDFKSRDKYPTIDPKEFNQDFASEQATGKYRDKSDKT